MADRTMQPQPKPSLRRRDRLFRAWLQVERPAPDRAGAASLGLAAGAPVPGTATAVTAQGAAP